MGLKAQYMRAYGASYGIRSKNSAHLSKIVRTFCKQHNMLYGESDVFNFIHDMPSEFNCEEVQQMSMLG